MKSFFRYYTHRYESFYFDVVGIINDYKQSGTNVTLEVEYELIKLIYTYGYFQNMTAADRDSFAILSEFLDMGCKYFFNSNGGSSTEVDCVEYAESRFFSTELGKIKK